MSNILAIILIVEIGLTFIPTAIASVFSAMFAKAFALQLQEYEKRVSAVEYKLRQIPIPGVEDEFENEEEYRIPPIPNSRETNSNGIPIARRDSDSVWD